MNDTTIRMLLHLIPATADIAPIIHEIAIAVLLQDPLLPHKIGWLADLPFELLSEANLRTSRWTHVRISKTQRVATRNVLRHLLLPGIALALPLLVTIIRTGRRHFDTDNLQISGKHVRDEVSAYIGLDDSSPLVHYSVVGRLNSEVPPPMRSKNVQTVASRTELWIVPAAELILYADTTAPHIR